MENQNKIAGSKKAISGIIITAFLMIFFKFCPTPDGLTPEGMTSIGIFLGAICLWVTEALPISVSALGMVMFMPILGVMDFNTALSNFGLSTALIIIATSSITVAFANSTIPKRLTCWIVKITKGNSRWIILGFTLACGILSSIMSNLACCALFFGFALVMLKTSKLEPGKSNLGRALMISLPIAAGIGGFLTPAGTPSNVLLMGILEDNGIHISFAGWCAIGVPLGLISLLLVGLWLPVIFKPETFSDEARQVIMDERSKIGSYTTKEKKTLIVIVGMLACWLLGTWVPVLNTATVAVLGMVVMFLPGVNILNWKEFNAGCNWNLVFICGAAPILMSGVTKTGAMEWIVNGIFRDIDKMNPTLMWIVVAIVICIIRALVPTTTAVIALFAPMLASVAAMTGANLTGMLMIPAFWGPAAMLIIYTEPIFLITFGEGYYNQKDLLKFGWFPSLILAILIGLVFPIYMPMLGLA